VFKGIFKLKPRNIMDEEYDDYDDFGDHSITGF
jgi:hypothetical protein